MKFFALVVFIIGILCLLFNWLGFIDVTLERLAGEICMSLFGGFSLLGLSLEEDLNDIKKFLAKEKTKD